MEPGDKKVVKVKVSDKRRTSAGHKSPADVPHADVSQPSSQPEVPASRTEEEHDFLEDLRRVQADFENYRKRVMRDQANVAARATGAVIESLLPVVDNFERAISHGEGGEGVELVYKELVATLEREGLEEIPALGAAFDPNLHEAVESREQEGLETTTVIEVLRRGYMFKEQLLRAAMVVVGRPVEAEPEQPVEA